MTRNAEILNSIRDRGEPLRRECAIASAQRNIDEDARTVELSVSSEAEVERWFGMEILEHRDSAIRLDRFNNNAALLMDHNHSDQVGKVSAPTVRDGKLRVLLHFSRSARGQEIFQDIVDGIRSLVSIGYRIHEVNTTKHEGGLETVRVVDWEPFEASIVSIPADISVGVGRSDQPIQKEILCTKEQFNSHPMRLSLPSHLEVVGLRP